MRVVPSGRSSIGSRRGERGAVAVMVAILAIVLFGFGAFAIDLGNSWQTRRHLVTASDASALAAAHDYAEGINGCALSADDFVQRNFAGATTESCTTGGTPSAGWVKVKAGKLVDWKLAGVLGADDQTEHSSTTATWGRLGATSHFVPIGICEQTPGLQQWLAAYTGGAAALPPEGSPPLQILLQNPDPNCTDVGASTGGNFAVLDFPGVNGASMLRPCVDPSSSTCTMPVISPPQVVSAEPGSAFSNLASIAREYGMASPQCASNYLATPEVEWDWIMPVYTLLAGANGKPATYTVVDFVGVDVYCVNTAGAPNSRSLAIRFKRKVTEGELAGGG